MARRNNQLSKLIGKLADDAEGAFFYAFKRGIKNSAENVIKDLQSQGPSWSGEFSNSWEIASASQVVSGSGAPGKPQPLKAPLLTNDEFKFKPVVKYYIANKAPHADVALDLAPYIPELDKNVKFGPPQKASKLRYGIRPDGGKRGELTGSGPNRATAPLDWYATYVQGGRIDKTISTYMDQALRSVKL
jgi:hypothetical protein